MGTWLSKIAAALNLLRSLGAAFPSNLWVASAPPLFGLIMNHNLHRLYGVALTLLCSRNLSRLWPSPIAALTLFYGLNAAFPYSYCSPATAPPFITYALLCSLDQYTYLSLVPRHIPPLPIYTKTYFIIIIYIYKYNNSNNNNIYFYIRLFMNTLSS